MPHSSALLSQLARSWLSVYRAYLFAPDIRVRKGAAPSPRHQSRLPPVPDRKWEGSYSDHDDVSIEDIRVPKC